MLASSKNLENFSASSVALLMISFKSLLNLTISLRSVNRISVLKVAPKTHAHRKSQAIALASLIYSNNTSL